ncbi:Calx-beta domain-containing protein, partial [Cylindrospermopsis raciborskii]
MSSRLTSGVTQIFSNDGAFAALKSDGSVVTWGSSFNGGDSSSVSSRLTSGVTQIFSNYFAFAALKSDGSVVTWGDDSRSVSSRLTSGVTQIFSNYFAFAALKSDGSVVTWGDSRYGGDSSSVSSQLTSGVVSFADPFNDDRLVPLSTTPTITIASTNANQSEGNSGTKAFTFSVTRSGDTTGTSSANWAVTGSGTNQADGTDFSGTSGTVSFAAGETAQTITVNVSGDSTVEPDEGFTVTLSNPTNATISTATAVGTIQNDDVVAPGLATVSLSLTSPSTVTEDGPQNLFYVFSRTGDVTNSLTVNFNVSGSATLN